LDAQSLAGSASSSPYSPAASSAARVLPTPIAKSEQPSAGLTPQGQANGFSLICEAISGDTPLTKPCGARTVRDSPSLNPSLYFAEQDLRRRQGSSSQAQKLPTNVFDRRHNAARKIPKPFSIFALGDLAERAASLQATLAPVALLIANARKL
jgi:hypothetical protein